VKTVADPAVLESLVRRLRAVQADSSRRWGTLTAHEMLCHLGDAAAMVVGTRPRKEPLPYFGTMSSRDWQRWAYRHTNHHLRQFGL
jgi:hypothetical protein